MRRTVTVAAALSVMICVATLASAQINFPKNGYYVAMGDSVAAGEGAMPVTDGYTYQLYFTPVPQGSRVAIVDLYTASLGRQGLVTIERRLGFAGLFDFDIHPHKPGSLVHRA
jgi:hypothetical protein